MSLTAERALPYAEASDVSANKKEVTNALAADGADLQMPFALQPIYASSNLCVLSYSIVFVILTQV